MPRLVLLVLMLTAVAYGQQPADASPPEVPPSVPPATQITEPALPVTQSDLYCAGFVSPHSLPRNRFVGAGLNTPVQSRYGDRELIFLRGRGYTPGTRVSIVREVRDSNRFSPFFIDRELLARRGQLYSDIGYAVVVENRGKHTAIAQVEFACESIVPGDLVAPFTAPTPVTYRKRSRMERFPENRPKLAGRIIGARDFDQYPGPGRKIYLDVGARNGIKPGSYFRVVRDYKRSSMDRTDVQIFNQTISEDTQKNPPRMSVRELGDLPRRVVGEAIVLSTRPKNATAMITFALEEIHIGDVVELEEEQEPTK